ncbi:PREDICTED: uncharacterized protein LOC105562465 [Vollenhovia emeryi]|uniref:uncharacterized protein LOC105562465 n=1 Tax=Vollenhovia emeryi TaxID=411798 RepID=UPI0005F36C9C|nr:PREDICTED: uncharacterized protein LOC105562465 [Vollenhovia emeryi]XP_011868718.1 PREDICTED: uncharacterized protein LOC105562465 [Vollenhovia emeryi]
MNEFLIQTMERRRKSLQLEAKPPSENAESMDISKEFLEVVALSFEVKDLSENNVCSEGDQIIRRLKSSVDKLFDVVNTQADVKFDDMVTLAVVSCHFHATDIHVKMCNILTFIMLL